MISSVINPGGSSRTGEFSRVNEFIFFAMFGSAAPTRVGSDLLFTEGRSVAENRSPIWRALLRSGTGPLRTDSPAKFYPIFIDPERRAVVGAGEPLARTAKRDDIETPPGLAVVWPLKPGGVEGRWDINRATFDQRLAAGHVKVGGYNEQLGQFTLYYLRAAEIARLGNGELVTLGRTPEGHLDIAYSDKARAVVPKTIWNVASHDAGTHGSSLIQRFIPDREFPFPKSLYAVEDAIRPFVLDKPDAVIVDFFAGSGTTAHAVARLNRQDGGRRRSIMVTNNEVSADEAAQLRALGRRPGDPEWEALGIFEHVTRPRVTAAISGRTPEGEPIRGDYKFTDEFPMEEGFEENCAFLELRYLDGDDVDLGLAYDDIAPLLWLRSGGRGPIAPRYDAAGSPLPYAWTDRYGVLFDEDRWRAFVADRPSGAVAAFVVTYSPTVFAGVAAELPPRLDTVRLYETYLSLFQPRRGRA
jgi:adenine-specific DNA-methyltransferase